MTDATRILNAVEQDDRKAADRLLPLVYEELRHLAALKMSHEPPGQTLQATALVHEAYLCLVGAEAQKWDIADPKEVEAELMAEEKGLSWICID